LLISYTHIGVFLLHYYLTYHTDRNNF